MGLDMETFVNSHYAEVKGERIHYFSLGSGNPMLFIHGIPTSSYLWRRIMPLLADECRCIAPDLIGMGDSSKPDIQYTVLEHIEYMEEFIEQLNLRDITLVLHGWGSVIGFELARRHPERVRAIAFFESHIRPITDWKMLSLPVQELIEPYRSGRITREEFLHDNNFLNRLLPMGAVCPLMQEVLEHYRKPYTTPASRQPLWQYLVDLPTGREDNKVVGLIARYSEWLKQSGKPLLMLYALPGFVTTMDTVAWAKGNLKNLTLVELDGAMHFAQESMPALFAYELRKWYNSLDDSCL
jgi:haloalkane dehalogenase